MSFSLDDTTRVYAEKVRGFLPSDEALALYETAAKALTAGHRAADEKTEPIGVEIGTYCGKSTVYLAAAARDAGGVIVTVDHHRGSEENQPGWEYHEPDLVDDQVGKIDTVPFFRKNLALSGLEKHVIAMIGRSPQVAKLWSRPVQFVFIDGGHTDEHATNDYEGWARWVAVGGMLLIHDVFEFPEDGGQAPWRVYQRAIASGHFTQTRAVGSLRVLNRVSGTPGEPLP